MKIKPLGPVARYGPFVTVAGAFALVLVIAPSKSPERTNPYVGAVSIATTTTTPDATTTTTPDATTGPAADQPPATDAGEASSGLSSSTTNSVAETPPVTDSVPPADCSRQEFYGTEMTCKPGWSGDNGGATSRGVTGDAVRIAYYLPKTNEAAGGVLAQGGLSSSPEQRRKEIETYARLAGQMFQTWGRRLDVVTVDGAADVGDAAAFRADAVRIDQEVGAAVVIGGLDLDFIDELARRGIPCLCGSQLPGAFARERAPFVFSIQPDGATTSAQLAEFICKRLGPGSIADHTGEVIHTAIGRRGEVRRRYGLAYPNGYWGEENAQDFKQRLASCGIEVARETPYASDINNAVQQATANTQASIQAGVTTVICICDAFAAVYGTIAATQQDYYPEWLVTGFSLMDSDSVARLYDQSQWQHAFGISSLAAPVPDEQTDWYRAYRAAQGDGDPNAASAPLIWPGIEIAAIAIELAGPSLDPQTFAQGMFGIRVRSTSRSTVSFGYSNDDFGGVDDFREIWWSPTDLGADGRPGAYQGVDDHFRHLTGAWPTSPSLAFRPECVTGGSCGMPSR